MATSEERRKILEMVVSGKISAEEAASMLNDEPTAAAKAAEAESAPAVEEVDTIKAEAHTVLEPSVKTEKGAPKWLHIRVSDLKSGRRKVSVNIPLRLVDIGVKIGGGFAPELKDIDWAGISSMLAEGEEGTLVEVEDEEDGEHVHIYVA